MAPAALRLYLRRQPPRASSLENFSFSKHFIMISRLFSKPLMPFLSWLVRRAAQPPHPAGLPASRTGASFPLGHKPEPEKPHCDAADTDAPSWQIFQLCGTSSAEQPRAECEGHLVGTAAKYRCSLQHRLPNTPQEPNLEGFSITKNLVYLVYPTSPTRCQGRGSRVAPGQPGEGMEAPNGSSVPNVNYSKRLKA